MLKLTTLAVAVGLASLAVPAMAQDTPSTARDCAHLTDATAKQDCLKNLRTNEDGTAGKSETMPATPAEPATPAQPGDDDTATTPATPAAPATPAQPGQTNKTY